MITRWLLLLEFNGNGLGPLIVAIFLIANSPAIIGILIGLAIRKNKPNTAKYLFILSGIYLIIGLGICGSILS